MDRAPLCRAFALALVLAATGCAMQPVQVPARAPAEVQAQLQSLLPPTTPDRAGWARDIQAAFQLLDIPPSSENLCAVLAVTAQESTFNPDPPVPNLASIAREEIGRRAAARGIPQFVLRAALQLRSADGTTYDQRLAAVRTEGQLNTLYQELVDKVPLGRRLLAGSNPVRTGGPMQVSIAFAERHARQHGYPYPAQGSIRDEVFTRRGGMYFGIAHLLDYPSSYERHIYRYADFNAGWYASRNAAFQAAVAAATGIDLALDGDLILHDGGDGARVGATEAAVRSLGGLIGMGESRIRRELETADRHDFERTDLYTRVFALAEKMQGSRLPRAVIPQIDLQSPKIKRKLTTEWFATRVEQRYRTCINKAFAG